MFDPLLSLSCDGIRMQKQIWSTDFLSEIYDHVINSRVKTWEDPKFEPFSFSLISARNINHVSKSWDGPLFLVRKPRDGLKFGPSLPRNPFFLGHLRVFGVKKVGHLRILTRDGYFELKLERKWMIRILGHLRISCICLHVTTSPLITFWVISGYPPYDINYCFVNLSRCQKSPRSLKTLKQSAKVGKSKIINWNLFWIFFSKIVGSFSDRRHRLYKYWIHLF